MKVFVLLIFLTFFMVACAAYKAPACKSCVTHALPNEYFPPLLAQSISAPTHFRFIYIEGDGSPWDKSGRKPAANPKVRTPLARRLMNEDYHDRVYLQRPCYGYFELPEGCDAKWWTQARYHQRVVDAMGQAIEQVQQNLGQKPLVLVGHSGGGTLAMLLAHQRKDIRAVVTVAANLDHKAWTSYFGYLPLSTSLNPVEQPLLGSHILRWHFSGDQDVIVPPALVRAASDFDPQAQFFIYKNHTHHRRWRKSWGSILKQLALELEQNVDLNKPLVGD